MKSKLNIFAYVAIFMPLLMSVEAQATIYKCVNAQAEVYYNDKPCHVTTIERKIKAVKGPVGGYIPALYSSSAVAEESTQNSSKKGLVIGGESTNKDVFSKKETQAGQSSVNSLNSASASMGDENNKSPKGGLNSEKVPVALGNSSNSNASTSNALTSSTEMNNHVGIH